MTDKEIKIAKEIVKTALIAKGFRVGSTVHWPETNTTQAFSFKSIPNTCGHPVAIAEIRNGIFTVEINRRQS